MLRSHLTAAQREVCIATGFFTVDGFSLIQRDLKGIRVRILIGFDEKARGDLQGRILAAILHDLSTSSADNRRADVEAIVERLRRGQLQFVEEIPTENMATKVKEGDHAKIYVVDDQAVIITSANLTKAGLRGNIEAAAAVSEDPDRVAFWREKYENFWNSANAIDITQDILDALEKWLSFVQPYDIYLKTLLHLVEGKDVDPPRHDYKMPVRYQQVVIERVLRQLRKHRGAMLVATTGLGKTVMGTHTALRLMYEQRIRNVIVLAPLQVKTDWDYAMRKAGISAQVFTRDLLDRSAPHSKKYRKNAMSQLLEALDGVDEQYLIIVDESQRFRNQERGSDGEMRHSFKRLLEITEKKHPFTLLLTATPYSKGVDDLNSQLQLLPHTNHADYTEPSGQMVLYQSLQDEYAAKAWKVRSDPQFFQLFIDLPVTTVISTAQVARDFALHTSEGDYIQYPDGKKWIPRIEMRTIEVPVLLEDEMQNALANRMFKHKRIVYKRRKKTQVTTRSIEQMAEIAWASSPKALVDVLKITISDAYKVEFTRSEMERSAMLRPILAKLEGMSPQEDQKLQELLRLIRHFHAQNERVLIFTERHATAVYLEQEIKKSMRGRGVVVESTSKYNTRVKDKESGREEDYVLKDFETEVAELVIRFAPEANKDRIPQGKEIDPIHVLIVTDAFSAGVNFQDASVVVHYDLAWTPDVLQQRSGRVLRLWKEPRTIRFFIFLSKFEKYGPGLEYEGKIQRRLQTLRERGEQAAKFMGLPVLPTQSSEVYESLASLANGSYQFWGMPDIGDLGEFDDISPLLKLHGELKANQARAEALPDDISSAIEYRGREHLLYLLLEHDKKFNYVVFNTSTQRFVEFTEDQLLNRLRCEPDTPVALVNHDHVESLAQTVRRQWMDAEKIPLDAPVRRVCALYFHPRGEQSSPMGNTTP